MKVLMVNSVCGIRSTGRICSDIAVTLEEQGHECKIAYGRESVPQDKLKFAHKIGSGFGVKAHAGLSRIFDRAGFYSSRSTKKFIGWIEEYKPDIIHLHNLHGYYINVKILFEYLKRADIPVVWTLHDCWSFTGHASYCDAIGCDKWQTVCGRCPQKARYPKSLVFDRSKSNYLQKKQLFTGVKNMTIVTPSAWLRDLVCKSFLGGYNICVVGNGVDKSVFRPTESAFRQQHGLEGKKIVLGAASAWNERKGFGDFIELSRILDDRFKVVMVGVTERQKAMLPDNILAVTRTENARQLAEIYSAADVFVNPTYEDVSSMVNLEAQACGTPAITYKTGGACETVPPENVAKQGDVQGLADLLNRELKLNDYVRSDRDMAEEYIKIYNKVSGK